MHDRRRQGWGLGIALVAALGVGAWVFATDVASGPLPAAPTGTVPPLPSAPPRGPVAMPPLDGGPIRRLHFIARGPDVPAVTTLTFTVSGPCLRAPLEVVTTASGDVELPSACALHVSAPGLRCTVFDDGDVEVERVAPDDGTSLRVRVLDLDGVAVPDATVRDLATEATTRCATTGLCVLPRVERMSFFEVAAVGHASESVAATDETSDLEVRLRRARTLTVVVDTPPLATPVRLTVVDGAGSATQTQRVDAAGRFVFDRSSTMDLEVLAFDEGVQRPFLRQPVDAGPDAVTVSLTLTPRRLGVWAPFEAEALAAVRAELTEVAEVMDRPVDDLLRSARQAAVQCGTLPRLFAPFDLTQGPGPTFRATLEHLPPGPCRVSVLQLDPRGVKSPVDDPAYDAVVVDGPGLVELHRR